MKQILTAGILAIGIHGLLLCMNFKWSGNIILDKPKPRTLNMTLTAIPIKTIPNPSLEKPKPVLEKPTIVKKMKKKPKPIVKTPPKKTVQIPVQSKENEVSKTIPEEITEKSESHINTEQTESQTTLKATKQSTNDLSPLKTIHEAIPIYRSNPSPRYPRIARMRGYQGDVLLDVLVNKDGKVHDLKIFKSSGYPVLDNAATSTVKNWLFEPGMIGDEKVDMWVRVPIRFELK
jgi:periplasmic protein TonB